MIPMNWIDLDTVKGKSERQRNAAGSKPMAQHPLTGECRGEGHSHCVDPGANGEEKFHHQSPDFQKAREANRKLQVTSLLEFIKRENRLTVKFHQRWVTFLMMQQLSLGLHSVMS